MQQGRIDIRTVAPEVNRGFRQAGLDVLEHGIEPQLKHLIDTRASQLNGCGHCLLMHVREAKHLGETDERLHLLAVWRETDAFTERERAALAWTEAVTNIQDGHAPDDVYEAVQRHFSPEEIVYLTLQIAIINGYNRMNVALRTPVIANKAPAVAR